MVDRDSPVRESTVLKRMIRSGSRISPPSLEKFSGGITPSQAVPAALQHSAGSSTIITPSTADGGYDAQATGLRHGTESARRQGARAENPQGAAARRIGHRHRG